MISTQPIERIITLVLATGYLVDETPGSLLLSSDAGMGKSHIVMQFSDNDSVAIMSDATAWGIANTHLKRLLDGQLKHLIFPEFLVPISKKKETSHTFLGFLNELMEEGVKELQTYAIQLELPRRVNAGVIACLTRDELESRKDFWNGIGLLSRFLPVSYSYSSEVLETILESVFDSFNSKSKFDLNLSPVEVSINRELARGTLKLARQSIKDLYLTSSMLEIRMVKHYMRLMKAAALVKGRDEVRIEDLDEITYLSTYLNLKYTEI